MIIVTAELCRKGVINSTTDHPLCLALKAKGFVKSMIGGCTWSDPKAVGRSKYPRWLSLRVRQYIARASATGKATPAVFDDGDFGL